MEEKNLNNNQIVSDTTSTPFRPSSPLEEAPKIFNDPVVPTPQVPEKKKKPIVTIILIIIAVLAIVFVCLWMFVFNKEEEKEPEIIIPDPNVVVGTKVILGDYEYTLINGYEKDEVTGLIGFISMEDRTIEEIEVHNYKYEDIVKVKDELKNKLKQGYVINSYSEETILNKKFLIYNSMLDGNPVLIAYTSLDDNHSFEIAIFNAGFRDEKTILKELTPTLMSAKYIGSETSSDVSDVVLGNLVPYAPKADPFDTFHTYVKLPNDESKTNKTEEVKNDEASVSSEENNDEESNKEDEDSSQDKETKEDNE